MSGGRRVRVGILADEPKDEPTTLRGKHSKKARRRAKVAARSATAAAGGKKKYSLLEVAIVHEFGGGHVPQRSFIRATIDQKRAEIQAEQVKAARAVLLGKVTPEVALQRLGAFVVGLMQARIVAGIAPPLAASTLRKKKGKATPLILTGQLRSGITSVVVG
jgi:hypothetical protein